MLNNLADKVFNATPLVILIPLAVVLLICWVVGSMLWNAIECIDGTMANYEVVYQGRDINNNPIYVAVENGTKSCT